MTHQLVCSMCQAPVGHFRRHGSQVLYQSLLADSYLFDPEFTDRTFELLGDLAKLHAFVQTVRADQVSNDATQRHAVGQNLEHGIDSYCPECNQLYCKTHYQVEFAGASGYGGAGWGTCPQGHKRTLFSDFMSC